MRDFELVKLSEDEFDKFSACHPQGNFQQTSAMGTLRKEEGKTVDSLGVKEHGELKAAGLLQIIHAGGSTFALIHDGPMCDFDDKELLAFFVGKLKEYAKQGGAAQLDITPEAVYQLHTQKGELEGSADDEMVANLLALGFDHVGGFSTGYTSVPRWRWVKDLTGIKDEAALTASYAKYRRRNVRIARESGVHTRRLERDELSLFHQLCELSCEKQGFENRPLSFFEEMYDAFGDNIEYRVAEIHFDEYLKTWQDKLDKLNADKARIQKDLERSRTDKRTNQLNLQLASVDKNMPPVVKRVQEAHDLLDQYGAVVPLDGSMFLYHPREVVCTTSGADERFDKFYAPALMHHEMMVKCIERGIPRYNLYGINGLFTPENNPGFGVLEFKQRFNGFVEEMPGEFVLPVKPLVYAAKQLAHKLLHR